MEGGPGIPPNFGRVDYQKYMPHPLLATQIAISDSYFTDLYLAASKVNVWLLREIRQGYDGRASILRPYSDPNYEPAA